MNIYSGLLFLHGHIADAGLARQLAGTDTSDRQAGESARHGSSGSPAATSREDTRRDDRDGARTCST